MALRVPEHDVRLSDGRLLRRQKPFVAEDEVARYTGMVFRGPHGMNIIVTSDPTPHGRLLHASVSFPSKDPTWEDLKAIKAAFFGDDVDAMILLPKAEIYVNLHPHCFHVWECPKDWGMM